MCDASACPRMCFQGTAMFSEIIGLLFHAVSGVLEFFPSRVARLLSQEDISIEGCARMRNTFFHLRHIYIYMYKYIYIYIYIYIIHTHRYAQEHPPLNSALVLGMFCLRCLSCLSHEATFSRACALMGMTHFLLELMSQGAK